ncbi:MAG: hypothetical protein ACTHM6_08100 [Tepidisphaeraceae bacterium]
MLWAGPALAQSPAGPATQPAAESAADSATTQPATQPATRPTAAVSADAATLLEAIAHAYRAAPALKVAGTLVGDFNVAGRHQTFHLPVTGVTDGHGRFLHTARGAGLLVSNGADAFLYDQKRNSFAKLDATAGRAPTDQIDPAIVSVLLDENPSLLLAVCDAPADVLKACATSIHLPLIYFPSIHSSSQSKDSQSAVSQPRASTLVLETPDKCYTWDVDPDTYFLTRCTIDFSPAFKARHAAGVKRVSAVLIYTSTTTDAPPAEAFSWSPPPGSTEMSLGRELLKKNLADESPATQP